MRITDRTLYATIEPLEKYFRKEMTAELKQAAEVKYGAMYDLEFEYVP